MHSNRFTDTPVHFVLSLAGALAAVLLALALVALADWFGFGQMQVIANGSGHVHVTTIDGKMFDILPGYALIIYPGMPTQTFMVKWDLGLLDLDRLAQVLPNWIDLHDGGNDLND